MFAYCCLAPDIASTLNELGHTEAAEESEDEPLASRQVQKSRERAAARRSLRAQSVSAKKTLAAKSTRTAKSGAQPVEPGDMVAQGDAEDEANINAEEWTGFGSSREDVDEEEENQLQDKGDDNHEGDKDNDQANTDDDYEEQRRLTIRKNLELFEKLGIEAAVRGLNASRGGKQTTVRRPCSQRPSVPPSDRQLRGLRYIALCRLIDIRLTIHRLVARLRWYRTANPLSTSSVPPRYLLILPPNNSLPGGMQQ